MKACIAYCYISIPTIEDQFLQLRLYLLTCQAALMHNMISQAESIFKTSITLISEMPESLEGKQ